MKSFFCIRMFRFSLITDYYIKLIELDGKWKQYLLFSKQKTPLNIGGIFLCKYIFVFPGTTFFCVLKNFHDVILKKLISYYNFHFAKSIAQGGSVRKFFWTFT